MKTDWMPRKRQDVLAMALQWKTVLAAGNRWEDWDFLESDFTRLNERYASALFAYNQNNSSARGPVTAAEAAAAFRSLIAYMRDIKRRYFLSPPLTDADLVALWLKVKDAVPTPVPAPNARPAAVVKLKSAGAFYVIIKPDSDISGCEKAYYGCKIAYGLFGLNDEPPNDVSKLTMSKFVRKKRVLFVFQPGDSGKRAYFAIHYENGKGDEGPWCPIFSVIVP